MVLKSKHYMDVAASLRDRIISGKFSVSESLGTERALSEEFSVSRVTVRRALKVLEDERLIRRIQGSGTYVNPLSLRRIPLRIDYTDSMQTHSPELKRKVLYSKKHRVTEEEVAALLKVRMGDPLLAVGRIDFSGKTPIAYDRGYINESFSVGLTRRHLAEVAFLEKWMEVCSFQISYCTQNIEAVTASVDCLECLKLQPGDPVLKSTEIYHTGNGVPAGLFISYYHPAYISIHSRYDWHSFHNHNRDINNE